MITWLLTAAGGFVLLGTWIAKGALRQPENSHLPAPVVFGHFLLAAVGLILWIIYLVVDKVAWAWVAFALLVLVALLGFAMLIRWIPVYRNRSMDTQPAERSFPVAVVGGHGVLAVVTLVLVFLTALGVGHS
ncbi:MULTISPECIES: hypothetical protein [unclassified Nocardia]|uniref:hypothetical protein n=1 Tax=unclassified Nocardia TaxID=2637762 RepID=UPI001CE3CC09|nr:MULTISPECIES: hypothetical protein [unclassified Nocardia]